MAAMTDVQAADLTSIVQCPCQHFQTAEAVRRALDTEEYTARLTAWLSSEEVKEETREFTVSSRRNNSHRLSCQNEPGNQCSNRLGTAFSILNAIREACRRHLDSSTVPLSTLTVSSSSCQSAPQNAETYEDLFPPLQSTSTSQSAPPTVLPGRIKKKEQQPQTRPAIRESDSSKSKDDQQNKWAAAVSGGSSGAKSRNQKRRIRPVPASTSSSSGWGSFTANDSLQSRMNLSAGNGTVKGNIAALPSEDPSAIRRMIHSSASASQKQKRKEKMNMTEKSSVPPSGAWGQATTINASLSMSPSAGHGMAKGNIAGLPSEDPSKMRQIIASSTLADQKQARKQISELEVSGKLRKSSMKVVSAGENSVFVRQPNDQTSVLAGTSSHLSAGPKGIESRSEINSRVPETKNTNQSADANDESQTKDAQLCMLNSQSTTYRAPKCSPHKHNDNDAIANEERVERLVSVYSTILIHHLAPSIAMELHLLVRLICVSDEPVELISSDGSKLGSKTQTPSQSKVTNTPIPDYTPIFREARTCRCFATKVFSRIRSILLNLGHELIKPLLVFPPFTELLPSLTRELRSIVEEGNKRFLFGTEHVTIASNTNTPMLTLPFDEARDSRHNYRTRDQNALYSNREDTRDAFLYQLREFQDVRGRLLDPGQAERSIRKIRMSSRELMRTLLPDNMLWFAELFCDLLLQIGLVPVEETDKEILKHVGDKDKLQKLHRRFTTKGGQMNKSSQKLVLDQKSHTSALSSVVQAEHFFPGHQEFFFLFLLSADSYNFGVQLSRRLVGLISGMASLDDVRGLEQRLSRLQLLSKFLGVLVFSPNWNLNRQEHIGTSNSAQACASENAIIHLNTTEPVLRLKWFIEEAWRKRRLVADIPWIVEYLRMSKWDTVSQNTCYYQHIFALLRSIHKRIGQQRDQNNFFSSNMQLVSFQLESLFSDVIGLGQTAYLPVVLLPRRAGADRGHLPLGEHPPAGMNLDYEELDILPLWFSKTYLFTSCPHLEELYSLVCNLNQNKGRLVAGGGASRKMRPYAVSSGLNSDAISDTGGYDACEGIYGTAEGLSFNPLSRTTFAWKKREDDKTGIHGKLIDAFFNQHRDLQKLCEFIVECNVKNVSAILASRCIAPIRRETVSSYEASINVQPPQATEFKTIGEVINEAERDALSAAREYLKNECEERIRQSLEFLIPPQTDMKVKDVATSLSIEHGIRICEHLVEGMVREEIRKMTEIFERREKKNESERRISLLTAHASTPKAVEALNAPSKATLNDLNESLAVLKGHVRNITLERVGEKIPKTIVNCKNLTLKYNDSVKTDDSTCLDGGDLSNAVQEFGFCFIAVLNEIFSDSSDDSEVNLSLILEVMRTVIELHKVGCSNLEMIDAGLVVCEPQNLTKLIQWERAKGTGEVEQVSLGGQDSVISNGSVPHNCYDGDLGKLLVGMVETKLLGIGELERSLLHALNDSNHAEAVARYCLEKLCNEVSKAEVWVDGKSLIMLRVRKELHRRRKIH